MKLSPFLKDVENWAASSKRGQIWGGRTVAMTMTGSGCGLCSDSCLQEACANLNSHSSLGSHWRYKAAIRVTERRLPMTLTHLGFFFLLSLSFLNSLSYWEKNRNKTDLPLPFSTFLILNGLSVIQLFFRYWGIYQLLCN